ncbi:MAG: hypothetical protein ACRD0P_03820 [Stackebrandtia sp.]
MNSGILDEIRQAAKAAGTTMSAFIEQNMRENLGRNARAHEQLERWRAEDEAIYAEAASKSYAELWPDLQPMSEEKSAQLDAQMARAEALWRERNS